jgi:hypothetical protein
MTFSKASCELRNPLLVTSTRLARVVRTLVIGLRHKNTKAAYSSCSTEVNPQFTTEPLKLETRKNRSPTLCVVCTGWSLFSLGRAGGKEKPSREGYSLAWNSTAACKQFRPRCYGGKWLFSSINPLKVYPTKQVFPVAQLVDDFAQWAHQLRSLLALGAARDDSEHESR